MRIAGYLLAGTVVVVALVGCNTNGLDGFLRVETETTVTYPDGRVEVIRSSDFDHEQWAAILAVGDQLEDLAFELEQRQAERDELEYQRENERLERRGELFQSLIDAAREGDNSAFSELLESLR